MATLRQVGSVISLGSCKSTDKRGASTDGHVFARELQRAGHAEPGRSGHRGLNSPPTTPSQAVLLLLSIPSGKAPKQAVSEAEILSDLVFRGATRTFNATGGSFLLPLELDRPERLEGLRFGDLLESLLIAYGLGLTPQDFQDGSFLPFGIRYGSGECGDFAVYERRAATLNVDGHAVLDQFIFSRTYDLPRRVDVAQRSIFVPIGLVRRIGELLGAMPGISAEELLDLHEQLAITTRQPAPIPGFGGVGRTYPGANLDFDSTTVGEA